MSKEHKPNRLLGERNPSYRPATKWSIVDELIAWASEQRGYEAPTNTALVELVCENAVKRGTPEWEITKQAVSNWRANGYVGESSWPAISAVTGLDIGVLWEARQRRRAHDFSPIEGFKIPGVGARMSGKAKGSRRGGA